MHHSEKDVRLELEAALATHHPGADWIRSVATKQVWGTRTVRDLVGLIDGGERVLLLQHIRNELYAASLDPETMSGRSGTGVIGFGVYTRENVPEFVNGNRERFDWIHPDWRSPPYPRSADVGTSGAERRFRRAP